MWDGKGKDWEIEALRQELHVMVLDKAGNVTDPEVMALSARLDHLIVEFEKGRFRQLVSPWRRGE